MDNGVCGVQLLTAGFPRDPFNKFYYLYYTTQMTVIMRFIRGITSLPWLLIEMVEHLRQRQIKNKFLYIYIYKNEESD